MAYVPPNLNIGTVDYVNRPCAKEEQKLQEQYIAETLNMGGATVNIFKLLGVHEQGKLLDLTGSGFPLASGTAAGSNIQNAFDNSPATWQSSSVGAGVLNSYLGYNFGKDTSYAPARYIKKNIASIRITQGANANNRITRARVERSDGALVPSISFLGAGNGVLLQVYPDVAAVYKDTISATATSPTTFTIISSFNGPLGTATVNVPFNNTTIRLLISGGSVPFIAGDTFFIDLDVKWVGVANINIPDSSNPEIVSWSSTVPSPFWRIIPTAFNGESVGAYWEVNKLELMDYEVTHLDDVQDLLLGENRDRDYAAQPIQIRAQYQPFDSMGDLGKFGLNLTDQYIFTTSFSQTVKALGRPIVVGDVIELPPEQMFDHNLNATKKYLEVIDTAWAAEGFSTTWTPLIFRFTAEKLIPGQEHRDIFGTRDNPNGTEVIVDNWGIETLTPIETVTKTTSENIAIEAEEASGETGSTAPTPTIQPADPTATPEVSHLTDSAREAQNTTGLQVEDGLPPDGQPYGEGYKLPDITTAQDGDYFRLYYASETGIPPRLYRFSMYKNKWIYIETDRRGTQSSFKPGMLDILNSKNSTSLKG